MPDRIDSRDLVENLNELESLDYFHEGERVKLYDLKRVIEELRENCDEEPENGIQMIPQENWLEYVEEVIDEYGNYVYDAGHDRTAWPYRHLAFDYEAAGNELKEDYTEIEYNGVTYLCR